MTDEVMEQWLLDEPAVFEAGINRQGKTIVFWWIKADKRLEDPITPNLRVVLPKFGYRGLLGYGESKYYYDR